MGKKMTALVILDGFGYRECAQNNAIAPVSYTHLIYNIQTCWDRFILEACTCTLFI